MSSATKGSSSSATKRRSAGATFELTDEQRNDIKEAFALFDTGNSGALQIWKNNWQFLLNCYYFYHWKQ